MSPRRCPLALTVLTLATGCFSDGGAELTRTATSAEPGTSTSSNTTTATTEAPDPGTSTTSTTGTTTDAPTGAGTTAPLCPGEMQCSPGDVMATDLLCDPCGRVRRTCQADCLWGADECVEDRTSCAYWHIGGDAKSWERVALPQPAPRHAPTAPVNAAFDLQADDAIVVLTQSTYHVLRGTDHTWIASGALADLLPNLPGPLLQAYAVYNAQLGYYDVYAVGNPQAWIYTLPVGSYQATFALEGDCCGSFTPAVNPGSPAAVRDMFVDLDAPFPWTGGQYYGECIEDLYPLGGYAGWLTATDIYVQDVGVCFQMEYSAPLAMFTPFAAAGAPPGDRIGGAALLADRLYVFAGE